MIPSGFLRTAYIIAFTFFVFGSYGCLSGGFPFHDLCIEHHFFVVWMALQITDQKIDSQFTLPPGLIVQRGQLRVCDTTVNTVVDADDGDILRDFAAEVRKCPQASGRNNINRENDTVRLRQFAHNLCRNIIAAFDGGIRIVNMTFFRTDSCLLHAKVEACFFIHVCRRLGIVHIDNGMLSFGGQKLHALGAPHGFVGNNTGNIWKINVTINDNDRGLAQIFFYGRVDVFVHKHRADQGNAFYTMLLELLNKKVGIVGFGAIGRQLGAITRSIGMEVYAYDPYFDEAYAKENGIHQAELETIIKECDFISLHVPVTDETRNMIGAKEIAAMKTGAVLINAARGGLVDEQAAADALKSGKLFAAAFDAFEQEPPTNSPLHGAPNVIMLPHTGAHTFESVKNMGMMAVENVIAELSGKDCGHRVRQ